MWVWIVAAALTAGLLAILLRPVLKGRRPGDAAVDDSTLAHDLAVYRDQLAELARDVTQGRIAASEADAARTEVLRRMLDAEARQPKQDSSPAGTMPRRLAILAGVALPLLGLVAYTVTGRPELPGSPVAERLASAVQAGDFPAMVARVEQHLAHNPNDAEGWQVIAPAYRRLGRPDDAADAYAAIIRLGKATPDTFAEYGEALILANDGLISAQARQAFLEVLKSDAKNPKARFYLSLADEQEGKREQALKGFRDLLADTPKDAAWRQSLENQIASLEQSPTEREAMIRGMVDTLDARLKSEGGDIESWLRLVRSRMVLGERDKAMVALDAATTHFQNDQKALEAISTIRRELGL